MVNSFFMKITTVFILLENIILYIKPLITFIEKFSTCTYNNQALSYLQCIYTKDSLQFKLMHMDWAANFKMYLTYLFIFFACLTHVISLAYEFIYFWYHATKIKSLPDGSQSQNHLSSKKTKEETNPREVGKMSRLSSLAYSKSKLWGRFYEITRNKLEEYQITR